MFGEPKGAKVYSCQSFDAEALPLCPKDVKACTYQHCSLRTDSALSALHGGYQLRIMTLLADVRSSADSWLGKMQMTRLNKMQEPELDTYWDNGQTLQVP